MGAGSDIRAGRSFVELYLNKTALVHDLKAVAKELEAWGKGITAVGKKMAMYGTAITAPMLAAVHSWVQSNSELAHMSERLGMTVQNLSALRYAAARNEVEFEAVESAVHRTNRALGEAIQGSQQATLAFARIGLSVGNLLALSPDQRFAAIADAIDKIQNPAIKDAVAMQIMGKGARELGPLLADLNESRKEAQKYGLIVSPAGAEAAKQLARAWTLLTAVFNTAKGAIGEALAPMMISMVRWMAQHVKIAADWVKAHKPLVVTLFQIGAAAVGIGTALIVAGAAVAAIGAAFGACSVVVGVFVHLIGLIGPILGFLISPVGRVITLLGGLAAYFLYTSKEGQNAIKSLVKAFWTLLDEVRETFGAIGDALSAGDISAATRVLWALLKLEWTKGTNSLIGIWDSFRMLWNDATMGLAIGFINGTAAIDTAFTNMTAGIRTIWADLINWLTKTWHRWAAGTFEEEFSELLSPIKAKFMGVDTKQLQKTIHEDFARRRAALPDQEKSSDAQTEKDKTKIEAERKKVVHGIERDRRGETDIIGQGLVHRNKDADAAEAARTRELDLARKELEAAQHHARQVGRTARPVFDTAKNPQPDLSGVDMSMMSTGKITGTFSGAAAGMIGGSGGFQMLGKKMDHQTDTIQRLLNEAASTNRKLQVGA